MYRTIYETLSRQAKALALLRNLLEEEYRLLLARETDDVAALEFSVHELIRQTAAEKSLVRRSLRGGSVMDYAAMLPEEQALPLKELFQNIDDGEQAVSRQASRNAQLSLALLDQSTRTLNALTGLAAPRRAETYGRRGGMRFPPHPEAAIISGRL